MSRGRRIIVNGPAKISRQGRGNPKSRYSIKWDVANYDYLIKRAAAERKSVAALVNDLVRRERGITL